MAIAVLVAPFTAAAQAPGAKQSSTAKAPPAKTFPGGWVQSRTPDGQPDLQGVWTNTTVTPFERPVDLADKPFLSEQEVAAIEKRAIANVNDFTRTWMDPSVRVVKTRQTSLVVDPPNGRVPLTPWAEKTRAENLARDGDSWEYLTSWDRCITRGIPAGMFPGNYNNGYQIVQGPGYVTIVTEMIHDARVIPLDGSPHLPARVRTWNGDSRGHWEDNTLVVDTTNYNDKGNIATTERAGRIRGVPQSEGLHIVERFTRISADTINYEVTIDDPKAYNRSWKVAFPFTRNDDYVLYEYACHEANYSMVNILNAGREKDKAKR